MALLLSGFDEDRQRLSPHGNYRFPRSSGFGRLCFKNDDYVAGWCPFSHDHDMIKISSGLGLPMDWDFIGDWDWTGIPNGLVWANGQRICITFLEGTVCISNGAQTKCNAYDVS